MDAIRGYCRRARIDNLIYEGIFVDEEESIVIEMAVYDRYAEKVTVTERAAAKDLFDFFEAADRSMVSLVEGFSGVHVAYGAIQINTTGEQGDFTILIDDEVMGTNLQAIPNVFIGRHAIEIVQERHFAPLVLFSSVVGIEEERTAEIVEIEIPYLTYEEAESFSSFDAIIHRNEQRLRGQHFEPRSCQLDGQRQTVQANSDLRQVRRFVIRDDEIRPDRKWPINKEPHGIKLGEAFEGQPSIGSRKLQRRDRKFLLTPLRQRFPDQFHRCRRHQDLCSVSGAHNVGDAIDGRSEVVFVALFPRAEPCAI